MKLLALTTLLGVITMTTALECYSGHSHEHNYERNITTCDEGMDSCFSASGYIPEVESYMVFWGCGHCDMLDDNLVADDIHCFSCYDDYCNEEASGAGSLVLSTLLLALPAFLH